MMMIIMFPMPVTVFVAPGIAMPGLVTARVSVNMTVICNGCISRVCVSAGNTKAHVSGIAATAIRVAPDRNATAQRDSCVSTRISGIVGQHCGGTEKPE